MQKQNESEETRRALLERNEQDIQNFRDRKTDESQDSHMKMLAKNNENKQNLRKKNKKAVDQVERRKNFSKAIIFGPIFICSCCARMLYSKVQGKTF